LFTTFIAFVQLRKGGTVLVRFVTRVTLVDSETMCVHVLTQIAT
jgi:hypothetical protein